MFIDDYCDNRSCDVRGYKVSGVLALTSLLPRRRLEYVVQISAKFLSVVFNEPSFAKPRVV